eukprot:403367229
MKAHCQECKQPLLLQQTQSNLIKESFVYLQDGLKQSDQNPSGMDDHDLYFFGLSGDASDNSNQVDKDLKIKDLVETGQAQQLQLKYPICFECFDCIIKRLYEKIHGEEEDMGLYVKELQKVEKKLSALQNVNESDLEQELKQLEQEDQELDKVLAEINLDEKNNQEELQRLQKAKDSLQSEEKQFWRDVNNYEKNLSGFQESLSQADYLIQNLDWQFKRLRNTNFINEVFYISTLDEFGTISGFRLGKLPTTDVKWDEINSAIGQSLYLLSVLAHRFNYKFEKYEILLCGAFSKISLKSNPKIKYELYLPSNEERFNNGLCCVLDALNSLCLFVCQSYSQQRSQERHKTLFKIQLETINGISIKYNSNDLPTWTKACKYFLTNLQYLIYMSLIRDQYEQQQQQLQQNY